MEGRLPHLIRTSADSKLKYSFCQIPSPNWPPPWIPVESLGIYSDLSFLECSNSKFSPLGIAENSTEIFSSSLLSFLIFKQLKNSPNGSRGKLPSSHWAVRHSSSGCHGSPKLQCLCPQPHDITKSSVGLPS